MKTLYSAFFFLEFVRLALRERFSTQVFHENNVLLVRDFYLFFVKGFLDKVK
jgi:hypothetical protein